MNSFFAHFSFEKRSHISQTGLKLARQLRLAFNLFSCLSLQLLGLKVHAILPGAINF